MFTFEKLTTINGFDIENPENAVQNSYAWSMAELGDYIYVGTERNLFSTAAKAWNENTPSSLASDSDNTAEIWRYKKGSGPCIWQRVFKAKPCDNVIGFRSMVMHDNGKECALYAAGVGKKVSLYKSIDGIHWRKIDTSNISGTSSRALVSFKRKLYIATLEEAIGGNIPFLYSSYDPEIKPFKSVIDMRKINFDRSKNPVGGIDDLKVFNNRLYVGIATDNGAEIWRSNDCKPRTNNWTLVADKGFGDKLNTSIMSSGVFKDHLYVAVSKKIPLALMAPLGFDLIKIDKKDNWELVVGGKPILPTCPFTGYRNIATSGYKSGFNNFFNVYGWQVSSFKDNLIITTLDFSTNVKTIITSLIYNKNTYIDKWGCKNYYNLLTCYGKIYSIIQKYNYPIGFDMYASKDGCHFKPINLNGLNNSNNYGGRTLYVSSENDLYLGTANPFDGLEVWQVNYKDSCNCEDINITNYLNKMEQINKELIKIYPKLLKLLPKTFTLLVQ